MKKITFLLALVSALTVTASAAMQNEYEIVNLPAYKVTAPRYTEGEKAFASGLAELRAKAQPALAVRTELPSLHTIAKQPGAAPSEHLLAVKAASIRHTRS